MESAPENQKEGFIPSENNIYPKSNLLISGKYKSTLLENQIMAYSFAHADQFDLGQSERETIKSTIKVSELRKLLGANSGSFYQKLSQTAESMTGRSIGMSTPDMNLLAASSGLTFSATASSSSASTTPDPLPVRATTSSYIFSTVVPMTTWY